MKKEMSSFDVRSVVNDMAGLKDAHMDKIFQWGTNVLFRINVQGQGKRDIFFKDKKWLYMPATKPETPMTPQSFATFLRKYLDNARIGDVKQAGFDRVVTMDVLKAEHDYQIIFEMFGLSPLKQTVSPACCSSISSDMVFTVSPSSLGWKRNGDHEAPSSREYSREG